MPPSAVIEGIVGREDAPPLFLARPLGPKFTKSILEEDKADASSIEDVALSIGLHLHGEAATYFSIRYADGLRNLDSFVGRAVETLEGLDARTLTRIARANAAAPESNTFTGEIEGRLDQLAPQMGATEVEELKELIAEVARQISKDGAAERMAELSAAG